MVITREHCEQFLNENREEVYHYLFKYFGSQDIVDQLVVTVGRRLWSLIQKGRISHDNARAWLYATAEKVSKNAVRYTFAGPRKLVTQQIDNKDVLQGAAELDQVVRNLPANGRSLFILYVAQGLSIDEIAEIWQVAPAKVRAKMFGQVASIASSLKRRGTKVSVRRLLLYLLQLGSIHLDTQITDLATQDEAVAADLQYWRQVLQIYRKSDLLNIEPITIQNRPYLNTQARWLPAAALGALGVGIISIFSIANFYYHWFIPAENFVQLDESIPVKRNGLIIGSASNKTPLILPARDRVEADEITEFELPAQGLIRMGQGSLLRFAEADKNFKVKIERGNFYFEPALFAMQQEREFLLPEGRRLVLAKKSQLFLTLSDKKKHIMLKSGSADLYFGKARMRLIEGVTFKIKKKRLETIQKDEKLVRFWLKKLRIPAIQYSSPWAYRTISSLENVQIPLQLGREANYSAPRQLGTARRSGKRAASREFTDMVMMPTQSQSATGKKNRTDGAGAPGGSQLPSSVLSKQSGKKTKPRPEIETGGPGGGGETGGPGNN